MFYCFIWSNHHYASNIIDKTRNHRIIICITQDAYRYSIKTSHLLFFRDKMHSFTSFIVIKFISCTIISHLPFKTPTFGNQVLVIAKLYPKQNIAPKIIVKRRWNKYSAQGLVTVLRDKIDVSNE